MNTPFPGRRLRVLVTLIAGTAVSGIALAVDQAAGGHRVPVGLRKK